MGRVTSALTSLKTLEITYPSPYENLQSTPTSLPTTEPATSQITHTVQATDLPTLNLTVESKSFVALMWAAGKNTDAAAQTVYWRILKNGASVATGSYSVSANYFWTLNAYFCDVVAGDTLEIRLWASSTNVNWDYTARHFQVSRVALLEKYALWTYNIVSISAIPSLYLGNPTVAGSRSLYIYHHCGKSITTTTTSNISSWKQNPTYKLFRLDYGDTSYANNGLVKTNATYRPYYYKNYVPTKIQLRGFQLGKD